MGEEHIDPLGNEPVVHQDVKLTPEGEKIWQEATNPDSEVGKPIGFKRRTSDKFISEASAIVQSWPKWKQDALGWAYVSGGSEK